MGIRDIIEQKKREFFVARDMDKRDIQLAQLTKQREQLEKEAKLTDAIKTEQRAIRDIRSNPTRQRLAGIGAGFRKMAEGSQRYSDNVRAFGNDKPGPNPFAPTGKNPFLISPKEPNNPEAKARPKTIVIKLKD